jgi:hypothetical protein
VIEKIFKCGDELTAKLLNNFYQKDIQERSILIKIENNTIFAQTVQNLINNNEPLSEMFFYQPTYFPLIKRDDVRAGTAWPNWHFPNFDTYFIHKDKKIIMTTKLRKKIAITEYVKQLKNILDYNINAMFEKILDKKTFLCYSRGIDSTLILSYILKHKLQDKIHILNFSNLLAGGTALQLQEEEKLGFKVTHINLGMDDLIDAINTLDPNIVSCYCSYSLMKKFKNCNFIFGYHGNQVLLHKKIFLEQINKDVKDLGYCTSLNGWTSIENPIPLAECVLFIKPWHKLNGINNNSIFEPLGNDENFDLLRNIDWHDVDPHLISNAKIARQIIMDNVGNKLDFVISNENTNELDCVIGDLLIPINKIKKEIFEIYKKSYMNEKGFNWLMSEYAEAKTSKYIKFNSLLSYITVKKYFNA